MLDYYMIKYGIKKSYTTDEFIDLLFYSKVVDARGGGLIMGRSHLEGNIYMYCFDGKNFKYADCNLQGGEYLVNTLASTRYRARLEEINNDRPLNINLLYYPKVDLNIETNKYTSIINTHDEPDKFLWVDDSFFIINHYSTAKHYKELEEINFIENYYRR